jgi:hypothetical protein
VQYQKNKILKKWERDGEREREKKRKVKRMRGRR